MVATICGSLRSEEFRRQVDGGGLAIRGLAFALWNGYER